MKTQICLTLAFAIIGGWTAPAAAEYTLILKNGRRLTVEHYREEKGIIKFNGLGGEIGISKDQIQAIRAGRIEAPGDLDLTRKEAPAETIEGASSASEEVLGAKPPRPEQEQAKEDKAYREKIHSLSEQLKAARDRYSEEVRHTAGSDPVNLLTEEQLKTRQADVDARLKDAQNNPSEPTPVNLLTPSPFSSLPPTITEVRPAGRTVSPHDAPQTFTNRPRELLDLRNQVLEIEKELERVTNEMREKSSNAGSIPGQ